MSRRLRFRGHVLTESLSVFELVSAFGGIGLTLGIPTENYSFCGAFEPLSKLIVIAIMVRGRHRGLPVAIDRASESPSPYAPYVATDVKNTVLLPEDLVPAKREGTTAAVSPTTNELSPGANFIGDAAEKERVRQSAYQPFSSV